MYEGNEYVVSKVSTWLEEVYHSKTNKTPKLVILHGVSGNGKTALVYHLAELFKVDVYKITSEDISTKENLNNVLQCLNICSFDTSHLHKIVLLDDIQDISYNTYIKIIDISMHPIIATSDSYISNSIPCKYLQFQIKKPRTSQIVKILKQHSLSTNYTNSQLEHFAKEAKSVRSAINTIYTGQIQTLTQPKPSILDIRIQLQQRNIQKDLDIPLVKGLSKNQNCYTEDGYKIFNRFMEFDNNLKVKFQQTIDKDIVNLVPEPIEKIRWFRNQKPKFKPKQTKKPKPQKKPEKSIPTYNPLSEYY